MEVAPALPFPTHTTTYEAPPTAYMPHNLEENPMRVQHRNTSVKLDALRLLRGRLHVVPSNVFKTTLVLHRGDVDREANPSGGLARLGSMESLVLDFLDAQDLVLRASMVCHRWTSLCRQDGLWEKFMTTPVEGYPLRLLLSLPPQPSIMPNIQVYMLFRLSGLGDGPLLGRALDNIHAEHTIDESTPPDGNEPLATLHLLETTSVASIHVQRVQLHREDRADLVLRPLSSMENSLFDEDFTGSCLSLRSWLRRWTATTPPPPPASTDVLRSLLHQLLHGLVALEASGLTHHKVSIRTIALHPVKTLEPNGSPAVDQILADHDDHGTVSVPLLQVAGHAFIKRLPPRRDPGVQGAPPPLNLHHVDESFHNRFWTCMKKPRGDGGLRRHALDDDEGLCDSAPSPPLIMLVSFMHCVLDICSRGRWVTADAPLVDLTVAPPPNPPNVASPRSLWRTLRQPTASLLPDCRAMLQCAAHLVYTGAPSMAPLLRHPYFDRSTTEDSVLPVDADDAVDSHTFMESINQWYAAELPRYMAAPQRVIESTQRRHFQFKDEASKSSTRRGKGRGKGMLLLPLSSHLVHPLLDGPLTSSQMALARYGSISAPRNATSRWLQSVAISQRLDLSKCVDLSSRTILTSLNLFGEIEQLMVPKAMLREPTVDFVVAALAGGALTKLQGVETSFNMALAALESSYTVQLHILNGVLGRLDEIDGAA
ncbi:hypothetical protein DYB38_006190 [Aphanomyces astaci]|uniref:F-box domain-containing protein n=3 Tax=Aphanomyces astaci TaxID=112090 RepID=A0A397DNU9_APHAT|nr:hypothetical protein DYB38_006190 [Aphanomyces astaci]